MWRSAPAKPLTLHRWGGGLGPQAAPTGRCGRREPHRRPSQPRVSMSECLFMRHIRLSCVHARAQGKLSTANVASAAAVAVADLRAAAASASANAKKAAAPASAVAVAALGVNTVCSSSLAWWIEWVPRPGRPDGEPRLALYVSDEAFIKEAVAKYPVSGAAGS